MRAFLLAIVQENGFSALDAHDGQEAILRTSIHRPNVIALGLDLPDIAGPELVRRVRECTDVPIIGITTLGGTWRKDQVLESGASDYLARPFGAVTFAAHLRGMLRLRARAATSASHKIVRCGAIVIDLARQTVVRNDEEVKLTPREYSLLRLLARNPGHTVTRDEILSYVWGRDASQPKSALHTYVSRLRRKLEGDPLAPRVIVTAAGGYSMASEPVARAS